MSENDEKIAIKDSIVDVKRLVFKESLSPFISLPVNKIEKRASKPEKIPNDKTPNRVGMKNPYWLVRIIGSLCILTPIRGPKIPPNIKTKSRNEDR